ncbi:hypothetical protein BGZ60DRAFT_105929 [Tricladium varicosporioides]|nr:hypothetical protein BGZ60DRAFT_105929 [Hymenoscyphus varicosporioides]
MARQTVHAQPSRKVSFEPKPTRQAKPQPPARNAQPTAKTYMRYATSRPIRQSLEDETGIKPQTRVSIAGVFKKPTKVTEKKRKHKRREETPKIDLFQDFKDGLETARSTMLLATEATFDDVHKGFLDRLAESRASDITFFESAHRTAKTLSAPLVEEQIEIITKVDGKCVTKVIKIGDRLTEFKATIETEEIKLKEYWKQWDDIQAEYVQLGIEVFGEEKFPMDAKDIQKEKGFKKELELLDLEHITQLEELEEEIEGLQPTFLKKIKASEKVSLRRTMPG